MPYPSYQTSANRYHNSTSRWVGIVFVVLLHVWIIYGLVYLLGSKAIEVIRGPIQVSDIKEEKPKEDDVKPPPPKVDQPPPAYVPPPEVNIASAAPAPTAITTVTKTLPTAPPPPPAPAAPKAVTSPSLIETAEQPAYPALSRRLEEEGVVTLKVLIGVDGSPLDAQVVKSTGFPRLDAAAIEFAKTRKYHPGMADGVPVEAWYTYNYRFVLD